jgi:hypothetical protein
MASEEELRQREIEEAIRQREVAIHAVRIRDEPHRRIRANERPHIILTNEDMQGQAQAPQGLQQVQVQGEPPPQPPPEPKKEDNLKLTNYKHFSDSIEDAFWDDESRNSLALDIIAIYLKGQKILYVEAKQHCENHLTMLMLPAIFISAACTVLSQGLTGYEWSTILVSALTAFNSFLLTLINYLKLDARAEAHRLASYQFDKLQTLCEFHSGKTLFFHDARALAIVDEIEKKVKEIKDNNQFVIPESVRQRYPIIYMTNVFTRVKKIENEEAAIKHALHTLIEQKKEEAEFPGLSEEKASAKEKFTKDRLINMYIQLKNKYLKLDEEFNYEISKNTKKNYWILCGWRPLAWLKN